MLTDIKLRHNDKHALRNDIVKIFIHGHSILDEAAFYELYITGEFSSKDSLDKFIKQMVPGFSGKLSDIFQSYIFWPNLVAWGVNEYF